MWATSFCNSICFLLQQPLSLLTRVGQWLYIAAFSISPYSLHLLPGSMSSSTTSSFCSTCPNHLNLFCFMASDTDSIPILSLSSALSTLSLSDTPHIHLTILIFIRSNLPLCSTVMAHVSLPYIIALLTHVTYSFPFLPSCTMCPCHRCRIHSSTPISHITQVIKLFQILKLFGKLKLDFFLQIYHWTFFIQERANM